MTDLEKNLLWELQQGFPLVSEPFAEAGRRHGLSGEAVIDRVRGLMASKKVRRLGVVFDARRLGYRSVLCAIDLPTAELPSTAKSVCRHPGVTHGYERGWPAELSPDLPGGPRGCRWPNFWFTLAAPDADFDRELAALRGAIAPHGLLALPAVRRFKIDVTFDPRTRCRDEQVPSSAHRQAVDGHVCMVELSPAEKEMVRALSGSLPLVARPYAAVAAGLGLTEEALLATLRTWTTTGVVRRIAMVVRHQAIGFVANGMCAWDVPETAVVEAGRQVAAHPEVTHCYHRLRSDGFPFTLYAMIHTGEWEAARRLFVKIGDTAGLVRGQLLLSLREFKKTSMDYFA
jgi:DNA-binding Lrp family transcriptional regulator